MRGEEKDVRTVERRRSRFSLRRLFYSPLLANPLTHRSTKKGRSSTEDTRSVSSVSERDVSIAGSFRHPRAASRGSSASETSQSQTVSGRTKSVLNESTLDMSASVECPLCLEVLPRECFPELFVSQCSHVSCHSCLFTYLRIQISESRTNISCPQCSEPMHPNDIHSILNDPGLWTKYEDFMLRRVLANDPDTRWCPAPDCTYAVIATGCAGCPKLQCERQGCNTYFCYHCKATWHPDQTCDKAREERSPNIGPILSYSVTHEPVHREEVKPCPRCRVPIVKMNDGSCNHMTCAVCGTEFCWLCMNEISDLHYLSPSGCTFWGSKPWSRKKKILWQLGTLVGAPVGIGLVAGIAVPAMVIGIPVWVGRKLKAHYRKSNKHKRNMAITGGVVASLVVSPVLAGLAVGIGVPILLAYVYGVVPVSLCRNGLCGVSTTRGPPGMRLDFDEEAYMLSRGRSQDTPSVELTDVRVANPSIGEVSFGLSASLSLGSAGRDSDRESASNTAIPAASLTGSIGTGSELLLGHSGPTRLEVLADVAGSKRHSLSSESASVTVSLSQCSAADDRASNVAMAGSLCNYRVWNEEHQPSLSPMSSFSGDELSTNVPSRRSNRRRYKDRQMSETASVWSGDERVRFDDNVSFIDDVIPTSEDNCSLCGGAVPCGCAAKARPTSQHRIRLQVHIEREEEAARVVIPVKFPLVRESPSLPHVEEVSPIRSSQSLSQLQATTKLVNTLSFHKSSPCIPSSC